MRFASAGEAEAAETVETVAQAAVTSTHRPRRRSTDPIISDLRSLTSAYYGARPAATSLELTSAWPVGGLRRKRGPGMGSLTFPSSLSPALACHPGAAQSVPCSPQGMKPMIVPVPACPGFES